MQWLWTWSGKSFGYIDEDNLWTHDGHHVGKRQSDEIYASTGDYIGEIMNGNRLITVTKKKSKTIAPFIPCSKRIGHAPYPDAVAYFVQAGFEDFPPASKIEAVTR